MIDFAALGERTVWVDCDVLEADGGTRCAAITGGFVALELALRRVVAEGKLEALPLSGRWRRCPAAWSTGARCSTWTTRRTRAPRWTPTW